MTQVLSFIAQPLGVVINFLYGVVDNYGLAIVLFTILVKLVLLPLSIKQFNSMQDMSKLSPRLKELQEKHKDDSDKLKEETAKLYQELGVNPMGGCLPLIIQMPILFALYRVISQPFTYILGLSSHSIDSIRTALELGPNTSEIAMVHYIDEALKLNAGFLSNLGVEGYRSLHFGFLGLDLSDVPSLGGHDFLFLIPVLAALATLASIAIPELIKRRLNPDKPEENRKILTGMNLFSPLLSGVFTFMFPAGVGLYWITSASFQAIQQSVLLILSSKKKSAES